MRRRSKYSKDPKSYLYNIPNCIKTSEAVPFVQTIVTSSAVDINNWVEKHVFSCRGQKDFAVGFDCEWKPVYTSHTKRSKVALVQIATSSSVLIVKMLELLDPLPANLVTLISSQEIIKSGVSVYEDLVKMQIDYDIPFGRYVDIGKTTARVFELGENDIGLKRYSLLRIFSVVIESNTLFV